MISEEVQLKSDFGYGQLYTCTKLVIQLREAAQILAGETMRSERGTCLGWTNGASTTPVLTRAAL